MSKRVTIMMDDDMDKEIRKIQSYVINSTSSSYSYSKAVNDVLRRSLK